MSAPVQIDRASYQTAVTQLRSKLVAYAAAVWATADLTDATITRLVGTVVPTVAATQIQVANLTSVYLAAATDTEPLPVDDAVTKGRGTPPELVYARPVIQARSRVSQGKPVADAFASGLRRLESLATTDVQMAKIRQADLSLQSAGVTRYRRVPQGSHTCALCLIASTQRYYVGNLMPIHPSCDCGVDELPYGMDLDQELKSLDLLEATQAKVKQFTGIEDRGGRAADYRHLLIEHEHGELGTVLGWRGQKFTGPSDVPGELLKPRQRTSVFDKANPPVSRQPLTAEQAARRAASNRRLEDLLSEIEGVEDS